MNAALNSIMMMACEFIEVKTNAFVNCFRAPGTDVMDGRLCVHRFWTKTGRETTRNPLQTFSRRAPSSQPLPLSLALAPGVEVELGLLSGICCSIGKNCSNIKTAVLSSR